MRGIVTLVLVLSSQASFAAVVAGPFTNAGNSHLYYFLSANTWSNAQLEAAGLGGHLATIQNDQEQDWVFSTFNPYASGLGIWIGLQRVGNTDVFQWITGEPLNYTQWSEGEPNNNLGGENCAEMLPSRAGKWNDLSGANSRFTSLKLNPAPPPWRSKKSSS